MNATLKIKMKLLKTLATAGLGLLGGLLFAQKSGKKFREELVSSKAPFKVLLKELQNIGSEVGVEVSSLVKNSVELQKVLDSGKTQFDSFVDSVKSLGKEASDVAAEELEKLSENAKEAAKHLKENAGEKIHDLKEKIRTIAKD